MMDNNDNDSVFPQTSSLENKTLMEQFLNQHEKFQLNNLYEIDNVLFEYSFILNLLKLVPLVDFTLENIHTLEFLLKSSFLKEVKNKSNDVTLEDQNYLLIYCKALQNIMAKLNVNITAEDLKYKMFVLSAIQITIPKITSGFRYLKSEVSVKSNFKNKDIRKQENAGADLNSKFMHEINRYKQIYGADAETFTYRPNYSDAVLTQPIVTNVIQTNFMLQNTILNVQKANNYNLNPYITTTSGSLYRK